jgi:hypothetical protein
VVAGAQAGLDQHVLYVILGVRYFSGAAKPSRKGCCGYRC